MSRETLRARLAAATPGPWSDEGGIVGHPSGDDIATCWDAIGRDGGNSQTNAALIAAARQDIPALLRVADAVAALPGVFEAGMQDPRTLAEWWMTVASPALAALEALP